MQSGTTPITNLDFLKSFTGNDNEKVKKYVNMFLSKAPEQLDALKKHTEAKNWEEVKIIAHSLKPQSGYMGIKSLEQDLRTIEDYAGNQVRLELVAGLVAHIEVTLNQAFAELEQYVKQS
ncbi:MAG: Hpt domain-containing protein [Chitinophagales bacterium]|nr:Hpt domain-containing protein [Chitinophagales bacterium]